jgi:hypothetical protein
MSCTSTGKTTQILTTIPHFQAPEIVDIDSYHNANAVSNLTLLSV